MFYTVFLYFDLNQGFPNQTAQWADKPNDLKYEVLR